MGDKWLDQVLWFEKRAAQARYLPHSHRARTTGGQRSSATRDTVGTSMSGNGSATVATGHQLVIHENRRERGIGHFDILVIHRPAIG
jgi:hypothetical protein